MATHPWGVAAYLGGDGDLPTYLRGNGALLIYLGGDGNLSTYVGGGAYLSALPIYVLRSPSPPSDVNN